MLPKGGRINALCIKHTLQVCLLVSIGYMFGLFSAHYGFIFERITVEVRLFDVTGNLTNVPAWARHATDEQLRYGLLPKRVKYVVPNIVHFVWFGRDMQMNFLNYVSIRSAHIIQKPEQIYLHCDNLPMGPYWERLWKEVPLHIVYREPPSHIHGQTLLHRYHKGDVAKLEILMQYGGIYMDYDVIMVRPIDDIRKYDITLGKEKTPKLIAGIIVANKESTFLKIWYQSYKNNYRPFDWDYNCARMAYQLYKKRPDQVHIEPFRFTTPDWTEREKLWDQVIDWHDLYVIHVMGHLIWKEYNPENIKKLNNTFGEVMRNIYYGSPKMIL